MIWTILALAVVVVFIGIIISGLTIPKTTDAVAASTSESKPVLDLRTDTKKWSDLDLDVGRHKVELGLQA